LLEDRRPTRSVEAPYNGGDVLRYCDAALQILEIITGQRFSDLKVPGGLWGRGCQLSNIKIEYRNQIISRIKTWWQNNQHKTEPQWLQDALSETGITAMWDRIEIANRLIKLEGEKSTHFFRERLKKEPDNPHAVSLLWKAGGNTVLEDIRPKIRHKDFYVRATAYRALIETQDPAIVDTIIEELQTTLQQASEKPDCHRTLIYILTRSSEEKAILAAARLLRHQNPIIVESTLVSFQTALSRENKPSPSLRRLVFPYMVIVLDDKNLGHWAAWWLIKAGQLPIEYSNYDRPQIEREKMIEQLKTWWGQHSSEYPKVD